MSSYFWTNETKVSTTDDERKSEVKNSASETITWFGGMFCRDSALLAKSNTMIILVNEVSISIMAGAMLKSVKRSKICSDKATS